MPSHVLPGEAGPVKVWLRGQGHGQHGPFLTASGSEWRSGAVACSLSSILEGPAIPQRYYLSPTACAGILRRAEGRGKELPSVLALALRSVAFRDSGGGNTSGPVDVAACLTARGQRIDFEVETFVAHTLRGEGFDASEDGTGRGTPLVPICFSSKDYGADAEANLSPTLRAGGHDASHANAGVPPAIAYAIQDDADDEEMQRAKRLWAIGRSVPIEATPNAPIAYRTTGNDGCYETGDVVGALTTATDPNAQVVAYAIQERAVSANLDAGPQSKGWQPDIGYTLEARANVQAVAFGFDLRGREGGAMPEGPHDTARIRAASGGSSRSYIGHNGGPGWAVRRLTPRETERLQAFPDDWTLIPSATVGGWRDADESDDLDQWRADGFPVRWHKKRGCWRIKDPDGPRYKAIGNSMTTNTVKWIMDRIRESAHAG